MKSNFFPTLLILLFVMVSITANAQVKLSVQGILKRANGAAVEDGEYSVTFRLYNVISGGTALWTETQSGIQIVGGIYSATLGSVTPLNLPFTSEYFLGVSFGSQEMSPRFPLTSAPYAISVNGASNKFPSAGVVLADSLRVAGGILAKGGAPGANGANKVGYAFTTGNGDKDSGLFSTAEGKVSLYANNTEILSTTNTPTNMGVSVIGDLTMSSTNSINYGGLKDWRLVETDYFTDPNDSEGWGRYIDGTNFVYAWRNPTLHASGNSVLQDFGTFIGKALYTAGANSISAVYKKQFNLTNVGAFTQVKVVFRYHFIDAIDGDGDFGYGAFATSPSGENFRVGWMSQDVFLEAGAEMSNRQFFNDFAALRGVANYAGRPVSDHMQKGEMVANVSNGTPFWVMFGLNSNEQSVDENFGVSGIEIYVK